VLFDLQIAAVAANALSKAGVDRAFVSSASQNEFFPAHIAAYRNLYPLRLHQMPPSPKIVLPIFRLLT